MNKIDLQDIAQYVEDNIGFFHKKRFERLQKLRLKTVLKRKNPYMFKAKNILTSEQIVKGIIDAHLSSSEETIFGNWLEGLAIFINNKVYGGRKSGIKGVDLEFDRAGIRYIVAIKSGPNWGNSLQIDKMKKDFLTAMRTLRTSCSNLKIKAVNGCCYGKEISQDKEVYFKYCGQDFWEFISGNKDLYIDIIEPLGYKAKEKNDEFDSEYSCIINKFTKEFLNDFCKSNGEIDWERLVKFNSGSR